MLPPPLDFSPPSIFSASAPVLDMPGAGQGWFQRLDMARGSLILALAVNAWATPC